MKTQLCRCPEESSANTKLGLPGSSWLLVSPVTFWTDRYDTGSKDDFGQPGLIYPYLMRANKPKELGEMFMMSRGPPTPTAPADVTVVVSISRK